MLNLFPIFLRSFLKIPRINTLNLSETKCNDAASSPPSVCTRTQHKSHAFFQMSDDCLWDNSVPSSYLRLGAPSTRKVLKIVFPKCSSEWNTVQFSTEVHCSWSNDFRSLEDRSESRHQIKIALSVDSIVTSCMHRMIDKSVISNHRLGWSASSSVNRGSLIAEHYTSTRHHE